MRATHTSSQNATNHPLRFSTAQDGTHGGGAEYTEGVSYNSSGQVTINVTSDTPDLFYYCSSHPGMGGAAATDVPHDMIDAVFELELEGSLLDFPVIDPRSDTISKLSIKDSNVTGSGENDIITSLQLDVSADAMVATLNDSVLNLVAILLSINRSVRSLIFYQAGQCQILVNFRTINRYNYGLLKMVRRNNLITSTCLTQLVGGNMMKMVIG